MASAARTVEGAVPSAGSSSANVSATASALTTPASQPPPPRALLLLGDFNFTPSSLLYDFMLRGRLQAALQSEGQWDSRLPQARAPPGPPRGMSRGPAVAPPALPAVASGHPAGPSLAQMGSRPTPGGGAVPGDGPMPGGGAAPDAVIAGMPPLPPPRGRPPPSGPPPTDRLVDESHAMGCGLSSAYGATHSEPEVTSFHADFEGVSGASAAFEPLTELPLAPELMPPRHAPRPTPCTDGRLHPAHAGSTARRHQAAHAVARRAPSSSLAAR